MQIAFLLALQAAGMVIDWYGNSQQKEISRLGTQIEQAGIESQLQMTRLESEEASVAAMKNLRKTLGSQAAVLAARGTRSGVGSALALSNESVTNFNADERMRRMNLLAKEANLRANSFMVGLHQLTYESQMGQALRQRFFDKLPMATLGGGSESGGDSGGFGGGGGNAGTALNKYSGFMGSSKQFGMGQFTG